MVRPSYDAEGGTGPWRSSRCRPSPFPVPLSASWSSIFGPFLLKPFHPMPRKSLISASWSSIFGPFCSTPRQKTVGLRRFRPFLLYHDGQPKPGLNILSLFRPTPTSLRHRIPQSPPPLSTGGSLTAGNLTGCSLTGGNLTGGNLTGGNFTGGNLNVGNFMRGSFMVGRFPPRFCRNARLKCKDTDLFFYLCKI